MSQTPRTPLNVEIFVKCNLKTIHPHPLIQREGVELYKVDTRLRFQKFQQVWSDILTYHETDLHPNLDAIYIKIQIR